jgi:hypothetical protein
MFVAIFLPGAFRLAKISLLDRDPFVAFHVHTPSEHQNVRVLSNLFVQIPLPHLFFLKRGKKSFALY